MNYPKNRYTGPKPWMNYEWLYDQYITQDKSSQQIADMFGCKQNTIQCWLLKHGIKKEIKHHNMKYTKKYQDPEYLYREHVLNNRTMVDIGNENGVSNDTIKYFLVKYNINRHMPASQSKNTILNIETINKLYFEDKMSAYAISKLFGCSHRTIIDTIRSYGKTTRSTQESQFAYNNKEIDPRYNDPEWLNKKFWDEGLKAADIGEILGVNASSVLRQMKRLGLNTNKGTKKPKNKNNIKSATKEYIINDIDSLEIILRDYFRINIRPYILKRDNHKCQLCGSTEKLHVHHIRHLREIIYEIAEEHPELDINKNEDLVKLYLISKVDTRTTSEENVITLCTSCHGMAHGKKHKDIIDKKIMLWKKSLNYKV